MAKNVKNAGLILAGVSALGLGAFLLYRKKLAVGQLRYNLDDVKVSLQGTALLLKIDLMITNPSTEDLSFKNFIGKIYIDRTLVGNVDIPAPTLLKARQTTKVTLSSILSASKLITTALDMLVSNNLPSEGIIDGILYIGNLQIPINETFSFK